MESADLKSVFLKFTANKPEMDNKTFAKLSKDCKVLDKKLTATDVDLSFAKVKTSSAVRTITYDQFSKGVGIWAEKKGVSYDVLAAAIVQAGGPTYTGTQGGSKFHDDKTTYTGAYKQNEQEVTQQQQQKTTTSTQKSEKKESDIQTASAAGSLEEVFNNFSKGAKDIDGKTFAKIAKDTHVLDKKLTATDIDLIFSKVVTKGQRRIAYAQFQQGVQLWAQKKGVTMEDISEKICSCGGPVLHGTQADKVKFHDDKSLYTGVHQNGGPSTIDKDKISDISQTCDRTSADVRGVKH